MKVITVEELSARSGVAQIKFGPKAGPPPDSLDVIPQGPIGSDVLVAGLHCVIGALARGEERYQAAGDLLARREPRFIGEARGGRIIDPAGDLVSQTVVAIKALDNGVLPIQGPPGTGKTYVSSVAIAALPEVGESRQPICPLSAMRSPD